MPELLLGFGLATVIAWLSVAAYAPCVSPITAMGMVVFGFGVVGAGMLLLGRTRR